MPQETSEKIAQELQSTALPQAEAKALQTDIADLWKDNFIGELEQKRFKGSLHHVHTYL